MDAASIAKEIMGYMESLARSNNSAGAEAKNQFMPAIPGLSAFNNQVETAVNLFTGLRGPLSENINIYRKTSKVGATFNNDVVQMSFASRGARLSLEEFSEAISANSVNFTGLGTSVGNGAKAFADLSKSMFDAQEATDSLRRIGYTNKELNDVLALQIGFQKSTMSLEGDRMKQSLGAATNLATEMDLMARLTGKSRDMQMEEMKKAQADAAVEAKFRLIGIQHGADAEAKVREQFAEQYNAAQLRGQGETFKQVFASGTLLTKQAAMEYAAAGRAGQATMEQARALANVDIEGAAAASERAVAETMRNQSNTALLTLTTLGAAGGEFTQTLGRLQTENQGLTNVVNRLRQEEEHRGKSEAELFAIAKQQATVEQEKIGGVTTSLVNMEQRLQEVGLAFNEAITQPLYDKVLPSLNSFATTTGSLVTATNEAGQVTLSFKQFLSENLNNARLRGNGEQAPSQMEIVGDGIGTKALQFAVDTASVAVEGTTKAVNQAGDLVSAFSSGVDAGQATQPAESGQPERPVGQLLDITTGLGSDRNSPIYTEIVNLPGNYAGNKFITQPTLSAVAEKEPEFILTQPQMASEIKGAFNEGSRRAMSAVEQVQNIVNDVLTPISTSLSSTARSATPVQVNVQQNAPTDFNSHLMREFTELRSKVGDLGAKYITPNAINDNMTKYADTTKAERNEIIESEYKTLNELLRHRRDATLALRALQDEANYTELSDEAKHTLAVQQLTVDNYEKDIASTRAHIFALRNFDDIRANAELTTAKQTTNALTATYATQTATVETAADRINKLDFGKALVQSADNWSMSLDRNGMPRFAKTQAKANEIPTAQDERKAAEEQRRRNEEDQRRRAAEEAAVRENTQQQSATPTATSKAKSLDDVVNSIDRLNSKMGELITQTADIGRRQISATQASSGTIR